MEVRAACYGNDSVLQRNVAKDGKKAGGDGREDFDGTQVLSTQNPLFRSPVIMEIVLLCHPGKDQMLTLRAVPTKWPLKPPANA